MQNVLYALAIAATVALLSFFTSWWFSVAIVGLLAGIVLVKRRPLVLWSIALLGGALAWGVYAAYFNVVNEGLLAGRVGVAFGELGPWTMVLVTALLGGIYCGAGALVGYYGRKALQE